MAQYLKVVDAEDPSESGDTDEGESDSSSDESEHDSSDPSSRENHGVSSFPNCYNMSNCA